MCELTGWNTRIKRRIFLESLPSGFFEKFLGYEWRFWEVLNDVVFMLNSQLLTGYSEKTNNTTITTTRHHHQPDTSTDTINPTPPPPQPTWHHKPTPLSSSSITDDTALPLHPHSPRTRPMRRLPPSPLDSLRFTLVNSTMRLSLLLSQIALFHRLHRFSTKEFFVEKP